MNTSHWIRSVRGTVMMALGAFLVGCGGGGGGGGSDFPFVAGVWDGTAFQVTASTCPSTYPTFISADESFPHTINQVDGEIVLEESEGSTTPGRFTSESSFSTVPVGRTRVLQNRFVLQTQAVATYNLRSEESATVVFTLTVTIDDSVTGDSGECQISYSSEARKRG